MFLSLSFTNSPINVLQLIEIKYYRRCEESHQPTSKYQLVYKYDIRAYRIFGTSKSHWQHERSQVVYIR